MVWLRRYPASVWLLILNLAVALSGATAAKAQAFGASQTEVVIIDPNRLFAETLFGKRITDELEAESQALAEENRKIEGELRAEEKELTDQRPLLSPEEFRDAAEAFDIKVQNIRRERLEKLRQLDEKRANAQQRFLSTAQGVLIAVMRERGATVLLDLRSVVLRDGAIDITDEAVVKIDASLGTGEAIENGQAPATGTPEPEAAQD